MIPFYRRREELSTEDSCILWGSRVVTWLHDGSNCIANGDRKVLIKYVKNLVYAESEECLIRE